MRVLILGVSGMIGNAIFRVLREDSRLDVFGSIRSDTARKYLDVNSREKLINIPDIRIDDQLSALLCEICPEVIVNCIGLTKHHKECADPLISIPLNALLPHKLSNLCKLSGARLVHISTDCVFSGCRGMYDESDKPDAGDVYGQSKSLGEIHNKRHVITLRTSTIGHELGSCFGLLEWFLAQTESCKGYARAVFSGLPSVIFAQVVRDYVLTRPDLYGLYNVGATPINKYDLLKLISDQYKHRIHVIKEDNTVIDRSLNSEKFCLATGFKAQNWSDLISVMHAQK